MSCVTFWIDEDFKGGKERHCQPSFEKTESWDNISSAKFDPYTIAWFRYKPNLIGSADNIDDCFVNLSGNTTATVNRCYETGAVGEQVNMNYLKNVAKKDKNYGGTWNNDVERVWVQSIPSHESVCLEGVMPYKWAGKVAYNCNKWYNDTNNKTKIVNYCDADLIGRKDSAPCKWLENNDPTEFNRLKAKYCSTGSNIISTICKNWMNEFNAPRSTYDEAWYNYCRTGKNFTNDECLNYIRNNKNSDYRVQFDNLWNTYCATAAGKADSKCSCFDSDPKWAGQAFCFKPECSETGGGYRTQNMESTDCASVCQSIVAGKAGNDATLNDINVQIQCGKEGYDVKNVESEEPDIPPPTSTPKSTPTPTSTPPKTEEPELSFSQRVGRWFSRILTVSNILMTIGMIGGVVTGIILLVLSRNQQGINKTNRIGLGIGIFISFVLVVVGLILSVTSNSKTEGFGPEIAEQEMMNVLHSTPLEQEETHNSKNTPIPTESLPELPPKYRIKSLVKGKYISLCHDCNSTCTDMLCLTDNPGSEGELDFYLENVPESDKVALKSVKTGFYWTLCPRCMVNCPNTICVNGTFIGYPDSQFEIVRGGKNEIYLKGNNGLFLKSVECANPCTVEPNDMLACQGDELDRYTILQLEL